jgi:hypothetical protein
MAKRIQLNESQLKRIIKEAVEGAIGQEAPEKGSLLNKVSEMTECKKAVVSAFRAARRDKSDWSFSRLQSTINELFIQIDKQMGVDD